jgi:pimeloyl-ACP methyl ester carboxylesterase/glyoxylase-like metal-dependent hydrolase (beta-lactamase superfamily II)
MLVILLLSLAAPSAAVEEGLLETEPGVSLYWRAQGSGEPAVVVPAAFLLEEALGSLAERHRLILYDMRNRGRSGAVADPARLTIEGDLADLEAVRRRFALESFAAVGYSYLGKLVAMYAARHPERVQRLVQIGPVPIRFGSRFPAGLEVPYDDVLDPDRLAELRALRAEGGHLEDPRAYCEREWAVARVRLVGEPRHAERLRSPCRMPNEWPTRLAVHFEHHLASARTAELTASDLSRVAMPVLTVHGTRDRNAAHGSGVEWAALLPDARLLAVPGAAHAAWLDDETVVNDIGEFLAGAWPERAERVDIAHHEPLAQLRGAELLRRALERHGEPPGSDVLTARFEGAVFPRSQGAAPDPPFAAMALEQTLRLAGPERASLDEALRWPDFTARHRSVADGSGGHDLDLSTGRPAPPATPPAELRRRLRLRFPALLLRDLAARPASLRLLGLAGRGDEARWTVSADHDGVRLALGLDPELRLARISEMHHAPLLGDTLDAVELSAYERRGGMLVPSVVRRTLDGVLHSELRLLELQPGVADETALAAPEGRPRESAGLAPAPPRLEPLADRVWLARGIGGGDYNALVVDHGASLTVVEAPQGTEAMEAVARLLGDRFPGRRIGRAALTHHHFDHAGGVRALMAEGATILTTPGNVAFFREVGHAPHTISPDRLAAGEGTVAVEAVRGRITPLPGEPRIELHLLEGTPHADEMLFAWLPEARILFQGDLFVGDPERPEPARPQAVALLERLEALRLPVERLVGVHGAVATLADLRAAVGRRASP